MESRIIATNDLLALATDVDTLNMRMQHLKASAERFDPEKQVFQLPDVFISSEEACRLLDITFNTLQSIANLGLLDVDPARINKKDRYNLREIFWLQTQPYRNAHKNTVSMILNRKKALQ